MKKTSLVLALIFATVVVFAQNLPAAQARKTTTSATVAFDATTPKDNLPKAENKTVIGSIDFTTGDVAFEASVKNFNFTNPKMQEHFNGTNWMNSDQFPKFTYTGKIDNVKKIKIQKDGVYKAKVIGTMTIKGVSKPCEANGTITVAGGKISVVANLKIKLEDYGISGQQPIEAGKVAKEPMITVSAQF
ncbi:MAG: YceI family protein [Bacteroidetes bacterium]|nr:YceI family protein [Bacteroidota bacterium]